MTASDAVANRSDARVAAALANQASNPAESLARPAARVDAGSGMPVPMRISSG